MSLSINATTVINNKIALAVCLLLLIIISRLIFIESDIPVWNLSYYCPIDELYYVARSFTDISATPDSKAIIVNPSQVLLTKLSLIIFGNNYYGLRLPSVIFSLGGFSLFAYVFYSRFRILGVLVFGLFFLVDFSCVLMSRVAEPTSSRFFAMALAIFLSTKYLDNVHNTRQNIYIYIGTAATLLVLLFYPTNAFILLAVSILVVAFSAEKERIKVVFKFFTGCILGLFIFLIFMYSVNFYPNLHDIVYINQSVGGRVANSNSWWVFVKKVLSNIYHIKDANFFRLNLYFVISLLIALFISIFTLIRIKIHNIKPAYKLAVEDIVMAVYFFCFLLQSMFINDYPQRKLVIIYPFFVFLFISCWKYAVEYSNIKHILIIFNILLLISIVPHAMFSYDNIFRHPTYKYKESMLALSYLGEAKLIGGWSHGFRLYNKINPYMNKYYYKDNKIRLDYYRREISRAINDGYALGSLDYFDDTTQKFYNSIGMAPESVVFNSNDPVYPNVVMYTKYSSAINDYN